MGKLKKIVQKTLIPAIILGSLAAGLFLSRDQKINPALWYDVNLDGKPDAVMVYEGKIMGPTVSSNTIRYYDGNDIYTNNEGEVIRKNFSKSHLITDISDSYAGELKLGDFDNDGKLEARFNSENTQKTYETNINSR